MDEIYNLPKEIEEGNVEYKRFVDSTDTNKMEKYKAQMLWRLSEDNNNGYPEAIYYVGIDDDGSIFGLDNVKLKSSIEGLINLAKSAGISVLSIKRYKTEKGNVAKIIFTKTSESVPNASRVAFLGPSGNGKTTLIGVLTNGLFDNGKGSSRSNIFRYHHEYKQGVTSSIKQDIIGYKNDKLVNYNNNFLGSWENIVKNSDRLINIIDLPGKMQYLKTVLFGLQSHKPDIILIVISANNKIDNDNLFHIELCKRLNLNYIVILTKIDLVEDIDLNENYIILKEMGEKTITISNVTGDGFDKLHSVLNSLTPPNLLKKSFENDVEYVINDLLFVEEIGYIVSGILNNGQIIKNDNFLIGPIDNSFVPVKIVSIHKKQIPSESLYTGETGSMLIKIDKNHKITKHMMIISHDLIESFTNKMYIFVNDKQNKIEFKNDKSFTIFINNINDVVIVEKTAEINDGIFLHVCFQNGNIQYIKNNETVVIKYYDKITIGVAYEQLPPFLLS